VNKSLVSVPFTRGVGWLYGILEVFLRVETTLRGE